jgi:hypothetical protein
MTSETTSAPASSIACSRRSTVLRGLVVSNVVLVTISWSRWFSGDADHVGMVDRVLGHLRLSGFRVDVVWLVLSTSMLGLAFLYFISQFIRDREARINAAFCFFGVVAFCLFVYRALTTGVLDFG